ncbi:MAG: YjzC family protein [Bacillota bacterium]
MVNKITKSIKPGTDNQPPGEYKEVGARGGKVPKARTATIDKGDQLPPTQEPNREWVKKK